MVLGLVYNGDVFARWMFRLLRSFYGVYLVTKNGKVFKYWHLLKYPFLSRFCIEEQITIALYSFPYGQLVLSDIVAHGIPDISKQDFRSRRKVINACLEFGYRYRILDRARRSRLSGNDPIQFWSVLSEIKIGVWLERQGFQILMFEPPSATGGKGDYLIGRGEATIFVEVKTIFGESYVLDQDHMTSDIAQHCQKTRLPVESLDLLHYPRDYDYRKDADRLLDRLEETIRQYMPLKAKQTIQYDDDVSGISLEIGLSPEASRVVSRLYGGFSNILDDLKARLGMRHENARRMLQVSNRNIPSICIINDFSHSIDEIIIESALFGSLVEDHTRPPKVDFYREHDGKWSGTSPSKLNSVIVIRFEPTTLKTQTADVYLCPCPECQFSRSIFAKADLRWREVDENRVHVRSPRE